MPSYHRYSSSYLYPRRTPDIYALVAPRIFIPSSYPGYLYTHRTPDIYTLVPRICIPLYPGYLYPCTTDIYPLVPRIYIPSYPGYIYTLIPRTCKNTFPCTTSHRQTRPSYPADITTCAWMGCSTTLIIYDIVVEGLGTSYPGVGRSGV